MAHITANIHLRAGDEISVERGDEYRWIRLGGPSGLAIFAADAEMVTLRDAIDAYLAQGFAKAEAA